MKIEELIKDLDAVTLIEFKEYLTKNITSLCCSKDANAKIIFNNKEAHTCEKCNNKLNKNGKTKNGVQNIFAQYVRRLVLKQQEQLLVIQKCHLKFGRM